MMHDARSIVYGTDASKKIASLHSLDTEAQAPSADDPEATLKSVEAERSHQEQLLKAKFHQLEVQNSKASESSWQQKLAAADRKAAMIARNRAVPISPMQIARARLMRRKIAAQYRASQASSVDAFDPDTTHSMDAHSFIMGGQ